MNQPQTTNESASDAKRNTVAAGQLADPGVRPIADVVIFDGDCQFCQKQVARLAKFDSGKRLAFLSLHDPRVKERYCDLSHDALMKEMYVVRQDGKRYAGAMAVRYLSRRLPTLWWMMPFLHIPFTAPVWRWLYKQVAIRRYRWNKQTPECEDACEIHFGNKEAP